MEKRIRRPAGLTALFWRYLITTGIVVILLAVLWWFGMTTMMRYGIVYPANTAASGVEAVAQALSSGELDTEEIPYFYRWAIFDAGGQVRDPGNMDEKHLAYAEAALAGERDPQGMFYSQYHRLTQLPDGTTCVIQYDYSMPYGAEVLQRYLPEFQTCAAIILLLSWLAAGAISTHHFAGLLRRDAALLTGATETIAQQRLDTPLSGKARVREFGETLTAMEQMRLSLAQSLERQWAMEQQRRLELAALTHDLKTPLTVILANTGILLSHPQDTIRQQERWVVNTQEEAVNMKKLVDEMLYLARTDASLQLVYSQINLSDVVWSTVLPFESVAFEQGLTLDSEIAPDIQLQADEGRLREVVRILMDNACKYCEPKGKILVYLEQDGDWASLMVSNSCVPSMQQQDLELGAMFGTDEMYGKVIYGNMKPEEFASVITEVGCRMNEAMNRERGQTAKKVILEAKQYILDHYQDPELSVDVMCRQLHMSPAYFSTVFKRETGQTYIAYLTEVRLDKAVELLNTTDDKTYVIAQKVGYQEQNYFSYVFKKRFGISPTKFRGSQH